MHSHTRLSAKRTDDLPVSKRGNSFVSAELQRVRAGFLVTMNDRRGGKWCPPPKDRTHPTADSAVGYIRSNHPEVVSVFVRLA